jgi:hypothetical protein
MPLNLRKQSPAASVVNAVAVAVAVAIVATGAVVVAAATKAVAAAATKAVVVVVVVTKAAAATIKAAAVAATGKLRVSTLTQTPDFRTRESGVFSRGGENRAVTLEIEPSPWKSRMDQSNKVLIWQNARLYLFPTSIQQVN